MKSRSHRLPISEPRHDDWVDGSWTVDCICGVNFDDGEEMVDCDECGVWVHTRCSRYVKSDKSFACDKCKSKSVGGGGIRNDSEETEVAEFLVELPTKTLRMDNPNPASVSSRGAVRLWTEIPMEERVHVQGVPGGVPGLFSGSKMSSVFGPELWKCAGYVPKKFSFRYNEFPFMNDDGKDVEGKGEEVERKHDEKNVDQAENGVGALFSLSKNGNTLSPPVLDSGGVKSHIEGGGSREAVSPREKKKWDGPEDSVKKSRSVRPIVLYSAKRKKEGPEKDQSAKKKVRTTEQVGDAERRADSSSKAGSALSCDAKQTEFSRDRGTKVVSDGTHCGQDNFSNQLSDGLGECATNLASNECGLEATLRKKVSGDEISREKNRGDQVPARFENFSKACNSVASLPETNGFRSQPADEEVPGDDHRSCGDIGRGSEGAGIESHDKVPVAADVSVACPNAEESESGQDTNIEKANGRYNMKLKVEVDVVDHGSPSQSLPLDDVKLDTTNDITQHPESSASLLREDGKAIETSVVKLKANEHKAHDGSRNITVGSKTIKSEESPGNLSQSKQEPTCSEGSTGARKSSSGHRHGAEVAEKSLKSNGAVKSHSTAPYQHKVVVYVGKSASSSTSNIPKTSDNCMASTAQNPSIGSRTKELSESSGGTVRDPSAETIAADEKFVRPKKLLKESSRLSSVSRTSQSTKSSSTSDSKIMSPDAKDSTLHSFSKVSSVPNVTATEGPGDICPAESDGAPNMQNKATGSTLVGKVEKFYQSGSHLSSRGNVASMHPPASSNVPAILSDEELALLLHQELNSSPRVPRVPRMRHAGSLPQLTCPTATIMLMKRTSSGGKEHSVASRRKTKDFSGDGSQGSLQVDSEANKTDRKSSSTDKSMRDSDVDSVSRKKADGGSVKGVYSTKTTNVSSSLSSSNDANVNYLTSSRPLSRNASDDDPRTVSRPTNRTLPGLLAEFMNDGKRTTYKELCNKVLPHWPHLRKHNGERYAYSSHSQAVLDCLRNRSEWARLVDRGPKTNASKKRQKTDPDSLSTESEDDSEENREKHAKDVGRKSLDSQQEDFPKGKRKARKRRRLALQGRGVVRRRRRADVVSDDESEESFSNSSEDILSEEEMQGDGTSVTGNEASASSDEVR